MSHIILGVGDTCAEGGKLTWVWVAPSNRLVAWMEEAEKEESHAASTCNAMDCFSSAPPSSHLTELLINCELKETLPPVTFCPNNDKST